MMLRHGLLAGGLAAAAALLVFGDRGAGDEMALPLARGRPSPGPVPMPPDAGTPTPTPTLPQTQTPVATAGPASGPGLPALMAPQDRRLLIGKPGALQSQGLFDARSWAPAAAAQPVAATPAEAPVPVAPALPYTYLGRQVQGGRLQVFLAQGDQVLVSTVPGQLNANYRIEAASDKLLRFTYLPLNQTQMLPTGAND